MAVKCAFCEQDSDNLRKPSRNLQKILKKHKPSYPDEGLVCERCLEHAKNRLDSLKQDKNKKTNENVPEQPPASSQTSQQNSQGSNTERGETLITHRPSPAPDTLSQPLGVHAEAFAQSVVEAVESRTSNVIESDEAPPFEPDHPETGAVPPEPQNVVPVELIQGIVEGGNPQLDDRQTPSIVLEENQSLVSSTPSSSQQVISELIRDTPPQRAQSYPKRRRIEVEMIEEREELIIPASQSSVSTGAPLPRRPRIRDHYQRELTQAQITTYIQRRDEIAQLPNLVGRNTGG